MGLSLTAEAELRLACLQEANKIALGLPVADRIRIAQQMVTYVNTGSSLPVAPGPNTEVARLVERILRFEHLDVFHLVHRENGRGGHEIVIQIDEATSKDVKKMIAHYVLARRQEEEREAIQDG